MDTGISYIVLVPNVVNTYVPIVMYEIDVPTIYQIM